MSIERATRHAHPIADSYQSTDGAPGESADPSCANEGDFARRQMLRRRGVNASDEGDCPPRAAAAVGDDGDRLCALSGSVGERLGGGAAVVARFLG